MITSKKCTKTKVEDLKVGDYVDLASCPFLSNHPSAEFEFAQVENVSRETDECIAVSYTGIDTVGYKTGTELEAFTLP